MGWLVLIGIVVFGLLWVGNRNAPPSRVSDLRFNDLHWAYRLFICTVMGFGFMAVVGHHFL